MNEESPNNTFSLFLENKGTESFLIGLFALGQQLSNDTSLNENALTPNVDFASILNADTKTVNSNFTFRFNRADFSFLDVFILSGQNLTDVIKSGFNLNNNLNSYLTIITNSGSVRKRVFSVNQPVENSNIVSLQVIGTLISPAFSTTNSNSYYFNNTPVQVRSQSSGLSYKDIRTSQIAHAYRPLSINVFSENVSQVLNTMAISHETVNGDFSKFHYVPILDPYASQAYVKDTPEPLIILNGRTLMQYSIEPMTRLRMDFLYIYDSPARMFDGAIQQRIREEYYSLSQRIKNSKGRLRTLVLAN